VRQVGRDVGDLVGVERFGGGQQLRLVHRLDQRFANRVGDFQQDLAVALRLDQIPHQQALVDRQRLQDVGHVRRVQLLQLALQLDQVLLVHQILDQILARPPLPMDELLHQPHLGEQRLHLREVRFEVVLRLVFEVFGHGAGLAKSPAIVTRYAMLAR
jgi:hypothetical protein